MTTLAGESSSRLNLASPAAAARGVPEGTTELWLYDTKSPRLALKLTAAGNRMYYFLRYCSERKRILKVRIGHAADWSVSAARAKADELNVEVSNAGGVAAYSAKKSAAPVTLADLVSKYTEYMKAKGARHVGYIEALYRLNWTSFAKRRIETITSAEIAEKHDRIAVDRGKIAASGAVKLLRTLYTYAMDLELVHPSLLYRNPAKRVRVTNSRPREVVLVGNDLVIFLKALAMQEDYWRDYFLLLLLTAARRSAVAAMRWGDVDLDAGLWVIPEESSKTERVITVPLVPQAIAILNARSRLPAGQRHDAWVFPSKRSASGHLQEVFFKADEIRLATRAMGISPAAANWIVHDIRRTAATLMTSAGAPLTVVAKALGHVNIKTTPVYARAEIETVRAALAASVGRVSDTLAPQ